ncbi:major facilitator superfamily domain-containing protein [Microdochium bolleyi]|uniref:Major facilitator superfamily domain-containing protein n=1 Tax=Microdochium bolleyi TaxID=196109 RepID=A0A136IMM3_9PEZI|nr:major facilitator superfamily domain-containing protein [Microdochium bolleyi]
MPAEKQSRDRSSSSSTDYTAVTGSHPDKDHANDEMSNAVGQDKDLEAGRDSRAGRNNAPPMPTGLASHDGLEMLSREPTRGSRRGSLDETDADTGDRRQSRPHSTTTSEVDHTEIRPAPASRTQSRASTSRNSTSAAAASAPLAQITSVIEIPDSFYDTLSKRRKIMLVCFCSFAAFLSPISSTANLSATPEIAHEFTTTGSVINLSNALYLLFMGISPMFVGPLSQVFGRRAVNIVASWGFLAASIGSALSPNITCFFVMRVITAVFGTAFILAGNAVVSDIYRPVERGTATGFLLIGMLVGPAFGPFIGGVIVTYTSWRVIFWVQTGLAVLALLGSYLILPETIYHKRWDDLAGFSGTQRARALGHMVNPLRVIRLWRYPNVLLAGLASSSLLWNMYSLLAPVRYVLNPRYNLTTPMQGGLFYLAPGVGYLTGTFFGGRWSDFMVRRWIAKRGGERVAEDRLRAAVPGIVVVAACILVYGWTVEKEVGGIPLTVVVMFLQGVAQLQCFPSLNSYCLDVMPGRSAEVIGANYAMRYLAATVSIAVVLPAMERIGVGWFSTISAALMVAASFGTVYNVRYGREMRDKVDERKRVKLEMERERRRRKLEGGADAVVGPMETGNPSPINHPPPTITPTVTITAMADTTRPETPPPGTDISTVGKYPFFLYRKACVAAAARNYDEANDLSHWLLMQPDCSPRCEAGAHLILAHAPDYAEMQLEHAERGLKIYEAVEPQIPGENPRRENIVWSLQRARTIVNTARERLKEREKNPEHYTEEEVKAMDQAYLYDFWEQEADAAAETAKAFLYDEGVRYWLDRIQAAVAEGDRAMLWVRIANLEEQSQPSRAFHWNPSRVAAGRARCVWTAL